jgi:hypothetical protein
VLPRADIGLGAAGAVDLVVVPLEPAALRAATKKESMIILLIILFETFPSIK